MIYEYECKTCGKTFDIEHPMSETKNPSPETLKKITCPDFGGCPLELNTKDTESLQFTRVFSSTILKFDSLTPDKKRQMLANRSKVDFQKNVEERKRVMQGDAMNQLKNIGEKK